MKLKPCPFCGSAAESNFFADQANKKYMYIVCTNDNCPTDEIYITDRQKGEEKDLDWTDLYARWNTRSVKLAPSSKENCEIILQDYSEDDKLNLLMYLAELFNGNLVDDHGLRTQYYLPSKEIK